MRSGSRCACVRIGHSAGYRSAVTWALLLGGLLLGEARVVHSSGVGAGRRRLRALQPSVGFHVATEEQWPVWPTQWPTVDKTERFTRYEGDESKCTGMQLASDWSGEFWCTMQRESLNASATKATSCGGIPMLQGQCLHVQGGTFVPIDREETRHRPDWLANRFLASQPPADLQSQEWCTTMHAASDGMYVEDDLDPNATMPVRTGPDIGMEAEYTNERCQVLGLTHDKLLRAFGGQTLLMLGDTHVRAMFVAAVATLRQKQHFVDVDSRAHDVLQYSMGTTGDRLSSVPLRSFPGLTPTSAAAAAAEAGSAFETYSGCATKGVGSPCVDLVFAWAPQFRDQVEVTEPLLTALKPTVVLAAVSGWEQTIDLDKQYQRMWDGLFDKHTRIKSFTFAVWPFNNPVAGERLEKAREWLTKATSNKHPKGVGTMRFNVLDMSIVLTNKITSAQVASTQSDVCGVRTHGPGEVYGVQAFAPCTGTVSRALVRVWMTFGRSMYDAHKLFQAETNTAQDDINAVHALLLQNQRNNHRVSGTNLWTKPAPVRRNKDDPNRVDPYVISGRFREK